MSRRRRRREPGIIREILGWIFYIIVILVLTYVIITYVGQRTSVSGSSMETTLSDGDQLLVDKLSYRFQNPKRFDIIVFPYQYEENTYYIKRIIGLPGETVQVVDGYVYINGSRLESDIYGNELMDDPMAASQPITLGEDEYFVLGDNRNHSQDSRDPSVGEVKKDTIISSCQADVHRTEAPGTDSTQSGRKSVVDDSCIFQKRIGQIRHTAALPLCKYLLIVLIF